MSAAARVRRFNSRFKCSRMLMVRSVGDGWPRTVPGASGYTALALAACIGDIERFPTPRSLPNYWGITPGCKNSGEATKRLDSITKEGSTLARFLLGQLCCTCSSAMRACGPGINGSKSGAARLAWQCPQGHSASRSPDWSDLSSTGRSQTILRAGL
jgi:hypothetical protein